MSDPTIVMAVLSAVEPAINSLLKRDPAAYTRFLKLDGSALRIELTDLDIEFCILVTDEGIRLRGFYDEQPQASIGTSSSALLQMLTSQDITSTLHGSDFLIEGDSALIIELQQLVRHYQLDLEALLANVLGDVVAHNISQGLQGIGEWLHSSSEVLQQNISEYLQEELHVLPSANEVACFVDDLQQTSLRLDRLEARISKLQQQADNLQSDPNKD